MAKTLQFRRGTTAELASVTGAVGELFVDTTKDTVVVMDGSTAGGYPLQKELVSGTSIKTINSTSLLGSGNISVQAAIPDTYFTTDIYQFGSSTYNELNPDGGTVRITSSNANNPIIQMWKNSGEILKLSISNGVQYEANTGSGTKTFTLTGGSLSLGVNVSNSSVSLNGDRASPDYGLKLTDFTNNRYAQYAAHELRFYNSPIGQAAAKTVLDADSLATQSIIADSALVGDVFTTDNIISVVGANGYGTGDLTIDANVTVTNDLIIKGSVPTTSRGAPGDLAGTIAANASYIYYCTANYTTGAADIWKRTAHGAGTW